MQEFPNITLEQPIQESIQSLFDVALSIEGGWGYRQTEATKIISVQKEMPLPQLQHMLITMRSHLEMNITRTEEERYSAINANEKSREKIEKNTKVFDKVTYTVTAIKEDLYHAFIKEYKAGYDDQSLDLTAHFQKRKEATLTREVIYYFEVSAVL
ncbi:MAG: hypothetical protein Q9M36_07830 [Sulfurovum sp.]|nr:hypothetical protein [Sulfurovum sp.]